MFSSSIFFWFYVYAKVPITVDAFLKSRSVLPYTLWLCFYYPKMLLGLKREASEKDIELAYLGVLGVFFILQIIAVWFCVIEISR